ncbi:hypothetical protein PspLS_05167 [Pyricularia sp. CBS 133598]|nr:hypothetical protein PspLS_05167 [Pyricularia sp. CBS 133598]
MLACTADAALHAGMVYNQVRDWGLLVDTSLIAVVAQDDTETDPSRRIPCYTGRLWVGFALAALVLPALETLGDILRCPHCVNVSTIGGFESSTNQAKHCLSRSLASWSILLPLSKGPTRIYKPLPSSGVDLVLDSGDCQPPNLLLVCLLLPVPRSWFRRVASLGKPWKPIDSGSCHYKKQINLHIRFPIILPWIDPSSLSSCQARPVHPSQKDHIQLNSGLIGSNL